MHGRKEIVRILMLGLVWVDFARLFTAFIIWVNICPLRPGCVSWPSNTCFLSLVEL